MDSLDHRMKTQQQRLAEKYAAETGEGANGRPIVRSPWFWGGVIIIAAAVTAFLY